MRQGRLARVDKNGKRPPPVVFVPDDWRDRRDEAQAKLAMLELQEREKQLMRVDLHERAMRLVASAVIAQFSAIPDKFAAEFAANADERRRIRDRLQDELNALRANLARAGAYADGA